MMPVKDEGLPPPVHISLGPAATDEEIQALVQEGRRRALQRAAATGFVAVPAPKRKLGVQVSDMGDLELRSMLGRISSVSSMEEGKG